MSLFSIMFSSRTKLIVDKCREAKEETDSISIPDSSPVPSCPPELQEIFDGLDSDADPPYRPEPWEESSTDSLEDYSVLKTPRKKSKKRTGADLHQTTPLPFELEDESLKPGLSTANAIPVLQEEGESESNKNNPKGQLSQSTQEEEDLHEVLGDIEVNQLEAELSTPIQKTKSVRNKRKTPESWAKNIRKKKRNSGQEYLTTTGQIKTAKLPKQPCGNCGLKCPEKIDDNGRKVLCEDFWKFGDINKQRDYICRFVEKFDVKRPRMESSRRKHSLSYKLPHGGDTHRVCKLFFLNTLSITEKKLRVAMLKSSRASNSVPSPDKRGKHVPHNKTTPERILHMEAHIDSFPRVPAHWCRKDTKKEYLEAKLNKEKMYSLYVEHCKGTNMIPLKQTMYREKLISKNIGFFTPRKDQCWCHNYEQMSEEEKNNRKEEYEIHTHRKNLANVEKETDKVLAQNDPSVVTANFDLQAVLYSPIEYKKPVFYKRKFATFNFTVYEVANKKGHCFVWDESNGKRGSNEIATGLYKFIFNLPPTCKKLILYSDCCPGQNRNSTVAGMLFYAMKTHPTIDEIELKFLEPGHTHMECDSMHAAIEKASEHTQIYWPNEWINIIKLAKKGGNPYSVNRFTVEDFMNFKIYSNDVLTNKKIAEDFSTLNWTKVTCLKFKKSKNNSLFFKNDFWDEYRELNVTRAPISSSSSRNISPRLVSRSKQEVQSDVTPKPAYTKKIPITSAKYKDLQDLCKSRVIPEEYHGFYSSLTHSGVRGTAEDENEDNEDDLELTVLRNKTKNKKRKAPLNK